MSLREKHDYIISKERLGSITIDNDGKKHLSIENQIALFPLNKNNIGFNVVILNIYELDAMTIELKLQNYMEG